MHTPALAVKPTSLTSRDDTGRAHERTGRRSASHGLALTHGARRALVEDGLDANLVALGADPLVVQVAKGTAHAAPPASAAANGQRVIAAHGEAARVDCACLRGAVELELAVCDDRAGAAVLVVEDTVFERAEEVAVGSLGEAITSACDRRMCMKYMDGVLGDALGGTYLLGGLAPLERRILQRSDPEGCRDGALAAFGCCSIGRNSLLNRLSQTRGG